MVWTWDDIDAGWEEMEASPGREERDLGLTDHEDAAHYINSCAAEGRKVPPVLVDFADLILGELTADDAELFAPDVLADTVPDAVYDV